MHEVLLFMILGLGAGAMYAGVGLGVVLTFRSSGVVNFAYGAVAMIPAYIFVGLRTTGSLVLPVPGLPESIQVGPETGMSASPAMLIALCFAALLGVLMHVAVFRPLRHATPLAKVVASVGVLITLQAVALLRYADSGALAPAVLPSDPVDVLGLVVPADRLYLAGIVVLLGMLLAAIYKYTPFGLATRASAENELSASFLGLHTDRLAAVNTVAASLLAGALGILFAPITALDPATYSLLIIPGLAAALVARFTSFGVTVAAALALGMLQSQLVHLQGVWSWLPKVGTQQALPFLIIVVAMVVVGGKLPTRASIVEQGLPPAIRSAHPTRVGAIAVAVALLMIVALPQAYRYAFVTTLIAMLVCLSLVVLTGYLGQISLAQMTFAGAAGFALPKLQDAFGLPFFVAAVPAVLAAGVAGVLVGLPALRVRGVNLAVVTMALAVAVSAFVFANPKYTGGFDGLGVREPNLFGVKIGSGGDVGYAVLCLVVVVLTSVGVTRLRRSDLGLQMLSVRANERAAASVGIDVRRVKILGFAISASLAGLAGVLLSGQQVTVTFQSFDVLISLGLLAAIFLGGVASVGGAVVGGFLASGGLAFFVLDEWIGLGEYQLLISGLALVLTAVFYPNGIVGGFAWRGAGMSGPSARPGSARGPDEDEVHPRAEHDRVPPTPSQVRSR